MAAEESVVVIEEYDREGRTLDFSNYQLVAVLFLKIMDIVKPRAIDLHPF